MNKLRAPRLQPEGNSDGSFRPIFSSVDGVSRVDDRRVISGIVFMLRNGCRWRDAPKDYGPHKTIYTSL